jgi:hypothetical protein
MLFLVTKKDVRVDNPELLSVPEFDPCTDRELKWIFLVYDFKTTYRQLSLSDRKEASAENRYVGYKRESVSRMDKSARNIMSVDLQKKHLPHIEPAIIAFKKMQRDIDREALETYDINLEHFMEQMKKPKITKEDWDLSIKITDKYQKFLAGRKIVKDSLDLRGSFEEEEKEQKETKVLSALDRRMRSKIENG